MKPTLLLLPGTLAAQPVQGLQRLGNSGGRGDRSRLERHHDRVNLRRNRSVGHPDALDHPETGAHQIVGQVGGAGEVVGNATELDHAATGPCPTTQCRALLNSRMRASTSTPIWR